MVELEGGEQDLGVRSYGLEEEMVPDLVYGYQEKQPPSPPVPPPI